MTLNTKECLQIKSMTYCSKKTKIMKTSMGILFPMMVFQMKN